MGDIGWVIADAACRAAERFDALPEDVRMKIGIAAMAAVFIVCGLVEGTAPSGMYY